MSGPDRHGITEAQIDAALTAVALHGKEAGLVPASVSVVDFVRANPKAREGMRRALRAAACVAALESGRGEKDWPGFSALWPATGGGEQRKLGDG